MDLKILLKEYSASNYLKQCYSSFEEYAEMQILQKNKQPKKIGYDENGFRVLGREGYFNDWDADRLAYFAEVSSHLKNNDSDPDLYERLAKNMEAKKKYEDSVIHNMKEKLKGFKHETN